MRRHNIVRPVILSCLSFAALSLGCSDHQSERGVGGAAAGGATAGASGTVTNAGGASGAAASSGEGGISSDRGGDGGAGAARAGNGGAAGASGAEEAGAAGEASWQLRALTYNTALAPAFEPLSPERAPQVVAALADAATQLDVMCVQEFWVESDFASLVSATSQTLGNTLHPEPKPGSGKCTTDELASLGACQASQCDDLAGGDLVGCLQENCATEIEALPGACLGCLFNNVSDFSHCAGAGDEPSEPAIFNGDSDIGLLSRYPMLKKDILPLDAYFQRGAVLYAEIEVPELGPVHAFCTHLSSSLGVVPYAGPDGSWDGEHTHEVEQLVNFIQAKATNSAPVLVMGDLNMGAALNGKPAVLPEDFGLLLATSLADPYLDAGNPECSECNDNSFRGADSTDDLIDHLLIKNFPESSSTVTRMFTTPVSIATSSGAVMSNLSDHYGIRLEISSTP